MLDLKKRPKSPYWIARGSIAGHRIERSTGCRDKADAKAALAVLITEAARRTLDPGKGLTFAQAAAVYLEHKPAARFLGPLLQHFGDVPVTEINNAAMRRAANRLYPEARPATLRRQLWTPVKAILNLAADEELCAAPRLKAPKGGAVRTVFVMPDQANALVSALPPHLAALGVFLFGQGARLGETLALDWRDVSLDGRFAMLRDTKNGHERRVTLIARTIAALSCLPHRAGRVFVDAGGKPFRDSSLSGGQIRYPFARAARTAGLDPALVTPHVARHSWATWFHAQTVDVVRMAGEGGWKSTQWSRYTHLSTPDLGRLALEAGWDFRPPSGEGWGTARLTA